MELNTPPRQADPLLSTHKDVSIRTRDVTTREVSTKKSQVILRLLFNAFCLCWIAPIVALLVLNFQQWIVGAGISCKVPSPPAECYPDILGRLGGDRHERTLNLDLNDREVLGVLQVVAKAVETWFTIVATSLICDFAMLLATSASGLPLRHLLTPFGFPRLPSLLQKGFWVSSAQPPGATTSRAQSKLLLFSFVVSVILLCIICNLMGPATAVLLIPTLGWSDIPVQQTTRFDGIVASQPPQNLSYAPMCDETSLDAGNYSCLRTYSKVLDEFSAGQDLRLDMLLNNWVPLSIISEFNGLLYTFNVSRNPETGEGFDVAPNYQVLTELSKDYVEFEFSQGNVTFQEAASNVWQANGRTLSHELYYNYRNMLDLVLHRKGPALGLRFLCGRATTMEQTVSASQSVRCVNSTAFVGSEIICFRVGAGWNDSSFAHSQFSIAATETSTPGSMTVNAYSTSLALFAVNTTVPCLLSPQLQEKCDWDYLFSTASANDTSLSLVTQPYLYVEYTMPRIAAPNSTIACGNHAYLSFPDYNIDVAPDVNSVGLVQLTIPAESYQDADVIAVHPDWLLAAWAVPRAGIVPGDRAAAATFISTFTAMASVPGPYDDTDFELTRFVYQHGVASLHALTLITYNTTGMAPNSGADDDLRRPILEVSKVIRVWAFGRGSRSAVFAVTVAILGCATVLARALFSLTMNKKRPSILHLVVAALRYSHNGELDDIHKESLLGNECYRVRFGKKDELILSHRDTEFHQSFGPYSS